MVDLLSGIELLLGTQLLVVGVLHLLYKNYKQSLPLAFLCFIFGLWFYKSIFYGYWGSNIFLYLLIGPDKTVFVPPLLFFFYKSYSDNLKWRFVSKHMTFPLLFYIAIFLYRNYSNTLPSLGFNFPIGTIIGLAIFWYYFVLTRLELKTKLKQQLISKAYRKVMFLFYSVYFFLLQVPIWDIYQQIININILPVRINQTAVWLYQKVFKYIGEDLSYTYLYILSYVLFLYALSELTIFKKFFLPKNALFNNNVIENHTSIEAKMSYYFKEENLFKDPDINIDSCARKFEITRKELIDYLNFNNKGVFKDVVNSYRVAEIKRVLKNNELTQYDLVGLANECGFNSKSTFFRVFKQLEGVTPNEYKKSLEQNINV